MTVPAPAETERALPQFDDDAHAFEAAVPLYSSIVEAQAKRSHRFLVRRFGDHFDDLRQAGYLALHEAVTTFDAASGAPLGAFVWTLVKRALWKAEHEIKRRGFAGLRNDHHLTKLRGVVSADAPIGYDAETDNPTTLLDMVPSSRRWALPCRVPAEFIGHGEKMRDRGYVAALAKKHGLDVRLVQARLGRGWSENDAIRPPKQKASPMRRDSARRRTRT
jgi:hypothetical protein